MIQEAFRVQRRSQRQAGMPVFQLWLGNELIGEVLAQDFQTLASRPTCHEMGCSGCVEGWAAEIARLSLETAS